MLPKCFVPSCTRECASLLTINGDTVNKWPICDPHLAMWVTSEALAVLNRTNFDSVGAKRVLVSWAQTEAVGIPLTPERLVTGIIGS